MTDESLAQTFYTNPQYKWKCELFGVGQQIVLYREEGKQPNWFWRKMQYLILGNKWRRI
jgi:hypothetical protein